MASQYSKYATLEPLLSGSTATYSSGSVVLYASASSPGADTQLYFFNGIGTPTNIAGGTTLTADGDSGGTVSVDLSTDTFDIAGGTGCDTVIAKAGTTATLTINLDMGEVDAAVIDVATDFGIFLDGGATGNTRKDSWADIATAQAGTVTTTGMAASSGVFNWDLQNWTASTSIADADLVGIDDGAGGTLRKMTRGNFLGSTVAAFSNGLTATTVDATTDFTIDGLVLTADTITNDAALSIVSTGLTLNASLDIALSADGGNVTMDDGTTTVFDFNTDDPELKIMDDAQVANYCSLAVGANGATTLTTVDADAAAANLIITADGTVDIDSAGAMTLDSGAGILLEPAAGSVITLDGTITVDAGVVAGATSVTSTNFDGIIGASTGRAGTFAALVGTSLNCSDGNITNVGDVNCDSVSVDAAATGLNLDFSGGNTGVNLISMADSLASALDITQGGNSFLKFNTTDDYTTAGKEFFMSAGTSVGASGWLRFGNDSSGGGDAQLFVNGNGLILSGASDVDNQGFGVTYVSGNLSASGDVMLGTSNSNVIDVNGVFKGAVMPQADDTYDLGHASYQWQDLYLHGKAYIDQLGEALDCDSQAMTNVNVDSGAIDGATIGAATPSSGKFTTLSGSGALTVLGATTLDGNLTLGSNANGKDFTLYGQTANEDVKYSAANHTLVWTDSSDATHITIGGDGTAEYAIDVATGSNAKNKMRAAAFVTYSDERLKHDVKPLRNALKTVNSLKAVNFTWKKDGSKDFGFLAQDLQKVVPQAVHGNETGLFGVDYGRLTAVLVSAIQEQSLEIAALKAEIEKK